jgi:hypothetical protein
MRASGTRRRQRWENFAGLGGLIAGTTLAFAGGFAGVQTLLILGVAIFVAGLCYASVRANGIAGFFLAFAALAVLLGLTAAVARNSYLGVLAIGLFVCNCALGTIVAAAMASILPPQEE